MRQIEALAPEPVRIKNLPGTPPEGVLVGNPTDFAYSTLTSMLRYDVATPSRATVLAALALIPGVQADPHGRNGDGQPGLRIARESQRVGDIRQRYVIVLDPTDHRFIGEGFEQMNAAGRMSRACYYRVELDRATFRG